MSDVASSPLLQSGSRSSKSVKQIVIKGLKDKPKVADDFKEKTWEKLELAVQAIFAKRKVESSLEELYKGLE